MKKKNSYSAVKTIFILLILMTIQIKAVTVKLFVDMKYQISAGQFNILTDKVYLRGSFNNWGLTNQMNHDGNGVYSVNINLPENGYAQYKFYTDAPGFPNNGYETNVGIGTDYRYMQIGTNNVELAKLYFNNMNLFIGKSTAHFEFYCADSDVSNMDIIAKYLEDNFPRITNALESTIETKVRIWVYPDQKTYFAHKGYPDSPSWSVGGAVGKNDVLLYSPNYLEMNTFLSTANHEFTHIAVAWKMAIRVPSWLNEGAATFYSDDPPGRPIGSIQYIVNTVLGGAKPTLAYVEQDNFGDGNGYPISFSVADFVFTQFGAHALANFIVNVDYSVLGYSSKEAFQSDWHKFLDKYYLAPQINTKFSIDMSYYISKGWFNPATDKVFVGGNFNNWYPFNVASEGNGIYSYTALNPYNYEFQYKFKINSTGVLNGGWEDNTRILQTTDKNVNAPLKPFNDLDQRLTLLSPNGDESFIAGDQVNIQWKYTTIANIKIEHSVNNGVSWSEIASSAPANSYSFAWVVPNNTSNTAKIRITDAANSSTSDVSDNTFKIVRANSVGGPYIKDQSTQLLMHFENDYINASSPANSGNAYNATSFLSSGISDLNKALKLDNSNGRTCVKVLNYAGINLTGSWTIEFWFYINEVGFESCAYPFLLAKGIFPSDYYLGLTGDGRSILASYTNTSGGNKTVPCGSIQPKVWYHVAFIRDVSKRTLSLVIRNTSRTIVTSNSITDDTTPKNTNNDLVIGGISTNGNVQFDGYVDELRISSSARDFTVDIEDERSGGSIPNTYSLMQNYPNPFNPSTKIQFNLPKTSFTRLTVYDILGKEVATLVNAELNSGRHEVEFNASKLSSGIYFYRLTSGTFTDSKKFVLLK